MSHDSSEPSRIDLFPKYQSSSISKDAREINKDNEIVPEKPSLSSKFQKISRFELSKQNKSIGNDVFASKVTDVRSTQFGNIKRSVVFRKSTMELQTTGNKRRLEHDNNPFSKRKSSCSNVVSKTAVCSNQRIEEEIDYIDVKPNIDLIPLIRFNNLPESNSFSTTRSSSECPDIQYVSSEDETDGLSKITNRSHFMKKNARIVGYNEWNDYRKKKEKIEKYIENDIMIKNNYDANIPAILDNWAAQLQAVRLHQHCESVRSNNMTVYKSIEDIKKEDNDNMKKCLAEKVKNSRYTPPKSRIRLMKSLISDQKNKIPVFCDYYTKISDIEIPNTMDFNYISENILVIKDDPVYKQLLELSEDNMSTFGKIVMRDVDHFFDTLAFQCSPRCGCKGRCSNNVFYSFDKGIIQTEIFRYDAKGFCIRTLSFIPYGTPVFQFNGEIVDGKTVESNSSLDYSFNLMCSENMIQLLSFLNKFKCFNNDYRTTLFKVLNEDWYVDPKRNGNEARFVTHACTPNLAMVRVFQNGFAPHQTKLIMIALEDIFPGTELSFDYGLDYIRVQLDGKCLCNTIGCKSNKDHAIISSMPYTYMFSYFTKKHRYNYQKYCLNMKNDTKDVRTYEARSKQEVDDQKIEI